MYQLARILFIVAITSAKLMKNEKVNQNEDLFEVSERNLNSVKDTLWILNINVDDLIFNKLFVANDAEEKVFKKIIAPAIEK